MTTLFTSFDMTWNSGLQMFSFFCNCLENWSTAKAAVLLGEHENENPDRSLRPRNCYHYHRHHRINCQILACSLYNIQYTSSFSFSIK
jgi:hypothetical protein